MHSHTNAHTHKHSVHNHCPSFRIFNLSISFCIFANAGEFANLLFHVSSSMGNMLSINYLLCHIKVFWYPVWYSVWFYDLLLQQILKYCIIILQEAFLHEWKVATLYFHVRIVDLNDDKRWRVIVYSNVLNGN